MKLTAKLYAVMVATWAKYTILTLLGWTITFIEKWTTTKLNLKSYASKAESLPPTAASPILRPEWLTRVLRDAGLLDAHQFVDAVYDGTLEENRGLASTLHHVKVTYRRDHGAKEQELREQSTGPKHLPEPPKRLIIKRSESSFFRRRVEMIRGSEREAIAYTIPGSITRVPPGPCPYSCNGLQDKDAWPHFTMPRALYTSARGWLGEYLMVLEDLEQLPNLPSAAAKNHQAMTVNITHLFGNQTWGVPSRLRGSLPEAAFSLQGQLAFADHLFQCAATMHGVHWQGIGLKGASLGSKLDAPATITETLPKEYSRRLNLAAWMEGRGRDHWDLVIATAHKMWVAVKAECSSYPSAVASEHKDKVIFSPKFVRLVDRSFAYSTWDHCQAVLRARGRTFTHGDFHAANMMAQVVFNPAKRTPSPSRKSKSENGTGTGPIGFPWWEDLRIYLYDWSESREWTPMADLGQMYISDFQPELYEHTSALVARYHANLCAAIAAAGRARDAQAAAAEYPLEVCWGEFCRAPVERWMFLVLLIQHLKLAPASVTQFFHDKLMRFVEMHGDHDEYLMFPPTEFMCP